MTVEIPKSLIETAVRHEVHTTTDKDRWPVILDLGRNPVLDSGKNHVIKLDAVAALTYDDLTDPKHARPIPYIRFEASDVGLTPSEELETGASDRSEDEIDAMLIKYLADEDHPNGTLDEEVVSHNRYWQSLGGVTAVHISGGEVLTSSGETIRTRLMDNVSIRPIYMKNFEGKIVPRLEVSLFVPVPSASPEETRDDV